MYDIKFIICVLITCAIRGSTGKNDCDNLNLSDVFRTPRDFSKVNFDHLEILERNNFDPISVNKDYGQSLAKNHHPKSVANAQVMLRFGGDDIKGKNCIDRQQDVGNYYQHHHHVPHHHHQQPINDIRQSMSPLLPYGQTFGNLPQLQLPPYVSYPLSPHMYPGFYYPYGSPTNNNLGFPNSSSYPWGPFLDAAQKNIANIISINHPKILKTTDLSNDIIPKNEENVNLKTNNGPVVFPSEPNSDYVQIDSMPSGITNNKNPKPDSMNVDTNCNDNQIGGVHQYDEKVVPIKKDDDIQINYIKKDSPINIPQEGEVHPQKDNPSQIEDHHKETSISLPQFEKDHHIQIDNSHKDPPTHIQRVEKDGEIHLSKTLKDGATIINPTNKDGPLSVLQLMTDYLIHLDDSQKDDTVDNKPIEFGSKKKDSTANLYQNKKNNKRKGLNKNQAQRNQNKVEESKNIHIGAPHKQVQEKEILTEGTFKDQPKSLHRLPKDPLHLLPLKHHDAHEHQVDHHQTLEEQSIHIKQHSNLLPSSEHQHHHQINPVHEQHIDIQKNQFNHHKDSLPIPSHQNHHSVIPVHEENPLKEHPNHIDHHNKDTYHQSYHSVIPVHEEYPIKEEPNHIDHHHKVIPSHAEEIIIQEMLKDLEQPHKDSTHNLLPTQKHQHQHKVTEDLCEIENSLKHQSDRTLPVYEQQNCYPYQHYSESFPKIEDDIDIKAVVKDAPIEILPIDKDLTIDIDDIDKDTPVDIGATDKDSPFDIGYIKKDDAIDIESFGKDTPFDIEHIQKDSSLDTGHIKKESAINIGSVNKDSPIEIQPINKDSDVEITAIGKESPLDVTVVNKEPSFEVKVVDKESPLDVTVVDKEPSIDIKVVDKESPVDIEVVDKESPFDIEVVDKESPLDIEVVDKESPLDIEVAEKESPLDIEVVNKESPLGIEVVNKESPLGIEVVNKESPLDIEVVNKESPLGITVVNKESPIDIEVVDKESPLGIEEVDKESPLGIEVVNKESPLDITVVHKEPPFDIEVVDKESPLDITVVNKESPLNIEVVDKESPLDIIVVNKESPVDIGVVHKESPLDITVVNKDSPLDINVVEKEPSLDVVPFGADDSPLEFQQTGKEANLDMGCVDKEANLDMGFVDKEANLDMGYIDKETNLGIQEINKDNTIDLSGISKESPIEILTVNQDPPLDINYVHKDSPVFIESVPNESPIDMIEIEKEIPVQIYEKTPCVDEDPTINFQPVNKDSSVDLEQVNKDIPMVIEEVDKESPITFSDVKKDDVIYIQPIHNDNIIDFDSNDKTQKEQQVYMEQILKDEPIQIDGNKEETVYIQPVANESGKDQTVEFCSPNKEELLNILDIHKDTPIGVLTNKEEPECFEPAEPEATCQFMINEFPISIPCEDEESPTYIQIIQSVCKEHPIQEDDEPNNDICLDKKEECFYIDHVCKDDPNQREKEPNNDKSLVKQEEPIYIDKVLKNVEPLEAVAQVPCFEEEEEGLEPNAEVEDWLKHSLVPYICDTCGQKLLVSYPVSGNNHYSYTEDNIDCKCPICQSKKFCQCDNCQCGRRDDDIPYGKRFPSDVDSLSKMAPGEEYWKPSTFIWNEKTLPSLPGLAHTYKTTSALGFTQVGDQKPKVVFNGYTAQTSGRYYGDPYRNIIYTNPTFVNVVSKDHPFKSEVEIENYEGPQIYRIVPKYEIVPKKIQSLDIPKITSTDTFTCCKLAPPYDNKMMCHRNYIAGGQPVIIEKDDNNPCLN